MTDRKKEGKSEKRGLEGMRKKRKGQRKKKEGGTEGEREERKKSLIR